MALSIRTMIAMGAVMGLLTACSSTPDEPKGPTPEEVRAEAQAAFKTGIPGVYEGVLPCADCSGIRTAVYVRAKGTYTRVSHYEGREGSWEEAGVWHVDFAPDAKTTEGATLVFEPILSDNPVWKALPEGNKMRLLDRDGKVIEGGLSSLYVLEKN